jgi:hypothetical protein
VRRSWVLGVLFMTGCATSASDCADAYQTGQRDGILAAEQSQRLAAQCGGSFDATRYQEGFSDGFSRRGRVMAL